MTREHNLDLYPTQEPPPLPNAARARLRRAVLSLTDPALAKAFDALAQQRQQRPNLQPKEDQP